MTMMFCLPERQRGGKGWQVRERGREVAKLGGEGRECCKMRGGEVRKRRWVSCQQRWRSTRLQTWLTEASEESRSDESSDWISCQRSVPSAVSPRTHQNHRYKYTNGRPTWTAQRSARTPWITSGSGCWDASGVSLNLPQQIVWYWCVFLL